VAGRAVAAIVGIASMLAVIAQASRREIVGLLLLLAVNTAVYLVQSRFAPVTA
jgi:hypothetical protein